MSLRKKMNLPKEHGAWAMLYVPFVLGTLVAKNLSWPVGLLLIAVSALFISRESLLAWQRARRRNRPAGEAGRWLLGYWAIAAASGLPLLLVHRFDGLLPLGLAGLALLLLNGTQGAHLEERSIRNELLAIAALTMTAPAAHYVAHGAWTATALWLWALSLTYFASSVFYVKLRVAALHSNNRTAAARAHHSCLFYHASLLLALLLLCLTDSLPLPALAAFLPALGRSFWSLLRPASRVNLKRAGWLEVLYSLIFLGGLTISFQA
ncbi:MAG: YwiC-like family protein [Blastocatellia bacterium]|nr:YwiC-like family protein [Blastocatellia bacterium]